MTRTSRLRLIGALYDYAAGAGIPMAPLSEEMLLWGGDVFMFPNYLMLPMYGNCLCYRSRPYNDDPEWCQFDVWSLTTYPVGREPERAELLGVFDKKTPSIGGSSLARTSPTSSPSSVACTPWVSTAFGCRTNTRSRSPTCTKNWTAAWPPHVGRCLADDQGGSPRWPTGITQPTSSSWERRRAVRRGDRSVAVSTCW